MKPIRAEVESLLLCGYFDAHVRGFCKGLWEHRQNLWTFVEVERVEPTNNAAELALRQAMIWRKLSFGTQSAAGSRFVERLLTVVETCRRQQRNVFSWMVEAMEARFAGKCALSL
jgi:transposase